jgi:serine/threonine protein kinase
MSRPRSSAGYNRPKVQYGAESNYGHQQAAAPATVSTRPSSRAATSGDGSKPKRQIVGQYMLGKTIGEGTFGKVKLAVHIPTGEKVDMLFF